MVELTAKIEALIVAFLFLIFGLGLGGAVVTTVQSVDTSGWNFTGHEAVESILPIFPIVYYGAIILGFLAIIFVVARNQ
jgi:hypothetical protein